MGPCLNPQCKSHGKVHPNCKCYGMAKGGEVGNFCDNDRSHNEDCEYYMSDGGDVPKFDDIPTEDHKEQIPSFDEMPNEKNAKSEAVPKFDDIPTEHETSYLEQAKTALEGFSQGVASDLVKTAETNPFDISLLGVGVNALSKAITGVDLNEKFGAKKEDIERREKEYPGTHLASKVGGSALSFAAGPAKDIIAAAGSKILGNMMVGVAFNEADKIQKTLLEQPDGNPSETVSSALLSGGIHGLVDGAMYSLTDGLFSSVKANKWIQNAKRVRAAEDAMISIAEKPVTNAMKLGAGYLGLSHIPTTAEEAVKVVEYGAIANFVKPYIEKIIDKPLSKANAYVGDAVLNALIKSDYLAIPSAIRYAQKIAAGNSALNTAIEGLFKAGVGEAHHQISKLYENSEEEIKNWVDAGGIDKEVMYAQQPAAGDFGFAKGGEVPPIKKQAFANLYPTQNMMLNSAMARASGYLSSLKPQSHETKLPFDSPTPQTEKKREYVSAIKIAANPLSVLDKMNKGTVSPSDIKHLTMMFPEVYGHISSKLTERITHAQLKGEIPPYKKRLAMGMFLGANLDSTLTPIAIQTLQAVYSRQKQARQQSQTGKGKTGKSGLSKVADSYRTDDQSAQTRQQTSKV